MIAPMEGADRAQFFAESAALSAYLSVESAGATYLVRTEDQAMGRMLFVKGARGEMTLVERAVNLITAVAGEDGTVGRAFVDVGANIGTSTIPALMHHGFGSAVCFEPEARNVLNLRANLLLNGLEDRARVFGVAVSDAVGTRQLMVDPTAGGTAWIADDPGLAPWSLEARSPVPVPTVTLDSYVEEGVIDPDRVGLLWIDAQAHEGHVLRGAGRLIERGVPIVLEWSPQELELVGDPKPIEDAAASQYTHFVDMRPPPGTPSFELRPGSALGKYAATYERAGGRNFTDLLLLRLDPAVASRLNVAEVLRGRRREELDADEWRERKRARREEKEALQRERGS
jgi:FkbM family methyltransferase